MTSHVIATRASKRHREAVRSIPGRHDFGDDMNNLALVPLACGLIIGLGAIGACNGIGAMGGK